ncbi:protein lev-9, partial [Caerostris darwini]
MKSFFIIIAFLGILLKTLAENSNCIVYKIYNGAFTESIEKSEWGMFTGTERWLENVQIDIGKTKGHGDYINVTCNTGYSFQGKGLNTNQVQCLNGKFHPNPVCLINGTIYQEETVPISNTSPTVTPETTITPQADDNTTCTCTYEDLNYNLVAYAGLTRLKYGSEVNRGEKVEFYCLLSGFSKLNGPTEITCQNCKAWDPSEFPTCVNPMA